MTSSPSRGLILLAHGARDPTWVAPFDAVAAQVRAADPALQVRCAYLEFIAPGLVEAGLELAAAGCTRITLLPLFLGTGGHVRRDVPRLIETLRAAAPQLELQIAPAIGEQPELIAAIAARALALAGPPADAGPR